MDDAVVNQYNRIEGISQLGNDSINSDDYKQKNIQENQHNQNEMKDSKLDDKGPISEQKYATENDKISEQKGNSASDIYMSLLKRNGISNSQNNSHRDDSHSFLVASSKFTVHKRYNLNKVIGHGAYGIVVSATDSILNQGVAIKKIPHTFNDLIDAKRILREIKLLMHFKHQNTIGMIDIMHPTSPIDQYEDVYFVTDLMETDLHKIIYSRQPLTDDHVQYFIYQILCALKYVHSAGVIHRDLKPSNLVLNSNCDLKVCDFGLARGVNDEQIDLTEYVVTRWYRAPEIMLSCKKYTFAIDVWSTGCIMAELLGRKPIFPGDDYIHQLQIISDILGSPTEADLSFVTSEKAKRFMLGLPKKEKIPLNVLYPNANPLAIDLLQKMLMFDPEKRISVNDALRHPYLEAMVNEEEETVCAKPFVFEYEGVKLDKPMLQELIWEQMMEFHPEARAEFEERRAKGTMKIENIRKRPRESSPSISPINTTAIGNISGLLTTSMLSPLNGTGNPNNIGSSISQHPSTSMLPSIVSASSASLNGNKKLKTSGTSPKKLYPSAAGTTATTSSILASISAPVNKT